MNIESVMSTTTMSVLKKGRKYLTDDQYDKLYFLLMVHVLEGKRISKKDRVMYEVELYHMLCVLDEITSREVKS